jgi:hypothetical protein
VRDFGAVGTRPATSLFQPVLFLTAASLISLLVRIHFADRAFQSSRMTVAEGCPRSARNSCCLDCGGGETRSQYSGKSPLTEFSISAQSLGGDGCMLHAVRVTASGAAQPIQRCLDHRNELRNRITPSVSRIDGDSSAGRQKHHCTAGVWSSIQFMTHWQFHLHPKS